MTKKLLSLLFVLVAGLSFTPGFASHQMASELTYIQIAANTYVVRLTFHRDCAGISEATTYPLKLTSQGCNPGRTINMTKANPTSGTVGTPFCPSTPNSCTATSGNYQKFIYTAIVTFSPAELSCNNWKFSVLFTDGNRPQTANVPGSPAMYIEAFMRTDNQTQVFNNSPEFNNLTPGVALVNQNEPATFSWLAYDPDGDSLSYSLVAPLSAANTPVSYNPGFTAKKPFAASTIALDSLTGVISFAAPLFSTLGPEKNKYNIAVKVTEWRRIGGVLIIVGDITRDMMVVVKNNAANSNPTFTATLNNQPVNPTQIIRIRPGTNMSLQLTGTDNNPGDVMQLTTDATSILPGATFTPSAAGNHAGTINWAVPPTAVTDVPYFFTVKVTDNACSLMGFETRTVGIVVTSAGTTTGTPELVKASGHIIVFPNPFQGQVTFKFNLRAACYQKLVIYNALGQQVDQIEFKNQSPGIQEVIWEKGAKMPGGHYTAKLISANQLSQVIRFAKQ